MLCIGRGKVLTIFCEENHPGNVIPKLEVVRRSGLPLFEVLPCYTRLYGCSSYKFLKNKWESKYIFFRDEILTPAHLYEFYCFLNIALSNDFNALFL